MMPLLEMQIGDQVIRYDREATAAIYANMKSGWAEPCGCKGCKNLIAQRDVAYPPSFRALLETLGIDPDKEAETIENGPLENGLHHYEGWFHFVGEVVVAGGNNVHAADSPYFEYFVGTTGAGSPGFRGKEYVAIEFMTHLKWVLEESPT